MFKVGDAVKASTTGLVIEEGEVFELDIGCCSGLEYRVREADGGRECWFKEEELTLLRREEPVVAQPPQDPKAKFGATKANLALNPGTAAVQQALALEDGAIKYGPYNWRYNPVEVMTYLAAAKRHLDCYIDGQDLVEDSGQIVHNLGAVMACCAIVLDATASGTLVDNRPHYGKAAAVQDASKVAKQDKWPDRRIDWNKGVVR